MRSMISHLARLAGVYFLTLSAFVWLCYSPPGRAFAFDPVPTGPAGDVINCPCSSGWFSTKDIFGANECAHGHQYDQNCPPFDPTDPATWMRRNCWELNGGVPATNGQICKCFSCNQNNAGGACEREYYDYLAFCTFTVQSNSKCAVEKLNFQYRRFSLKLKTQNGQPCAFSQGFEEKTECGSGKKMAWSCKTTSCVLDEDTDAIIYNPWKDVYGCTPPTLKEGGPPRTPEKEKDYWKEVN
jgi:hypothetical protein